MNARIRVPEVRCIDANGNQVGVITTREALQMASHAALDLVEISPNAHPPVCRIMDFGKFKYEQGKKDKQAKRNQSAAKVKEIQFHPSIGEHDYDTKVRHVKDFLAEGHRVKVSLFYRGRESAHQELGFAVMNRIIADCQGQGNTEQPPKMMGRSLQMVMCPKPGLKNKVKPDDAPDSPAG
ncbi:MAG: translation initiation factor IF-3 [Lentisphaerota bacterium]